MHSPLTGALTKRSLPQLAVRVGLKHRALAVETDDGFLWTWIGSHSDYDRLIKSL